MSSWLAKYLPESMHNYICCIGLAFSHCVFSYASSKNLSQNMLSHTYNTFLHCNFDQRHFSLAMDIGNFEREIVIMYLNLRSGVCMPQIRTHAARGGETLARIACPEN